MSFCHLCKNSKLELLINFGEHPISKHYLENKLDHKEVWPVKLYICGKCGLSQLIDSCPPELLYDNYVTLSSWKPQPQVKHEIETLKKFSNLPSVASIIEIGCNDAIFMEELKKNSFTNIIGIEPSHDAYSIAKNKGFEVINDFLSIEISNSIVDMRGQFDLVVSRQNFEHIADLSGVIQSLDILLKPNGFVLIELPNYECNLINKDYGLWEEHVNYFTRDTLRYFLSLSNIEILYEEIFLFSGEGIFVIGRKSSNTKKELKYVKNLNIENRKYAEYWPYFQSKLIAYLMGERNKGKKVAVYGASSRAFCLINFADLSPYIEFIIDDQLEKQDKFAPGSKLAIVESDFLYSDNIDICLLAVNTENEDSVINRHSSWVNQGGEFWSIFPPSNRLLPACKVDKDFI